MPVWLLVADQIYQRVTGAELSGNWLFVSIGVGALVCAMTIVGSTMPALKRVLFVLASWLLIAGEVLALAVLQLFKSGLAGTQ